MWFACLSCLCLSVNAVQGDSLEIVNPRATYGHLGATRPKVGSLPGEVTHFTFEVKNLKFDDTGKASFSIAFEIRDEAGKLFFEQRPYNTVARNFLGGDAIPFAAHVEIPLDAKPGNVAWKVTVVDRLTKKSVTLSGAGKILPADFGIIHLALFADPELRVPMPAVTVVGDSAYVQLAVVGFGRGKDKRQPDVEVSMRILDEKGQATMAKPLVGVINSDVDAKERVVPMHFGLTLNRAGRFTIELTATDKISGKRAEVRYPLRVLALE